MVKLDIIIEDTEIDEYLNQFDYLLESKDFSNVKMAFIMWNKSNFIDCIFDKSDLQYIKKEFNNKHSNIKKYDIGWNWWKMNIPNDFGNLINHINCQLEKLDKYESIRNRNLKRIHERNVKTL